MSDVKPVRLQLSRRKGFDLQKLSLETNGLPAAKVDRSTGLGNPFPVVKAKSDKGVRWVVGTWTGPAMWVRETREEAVRISVDAFRAWLMQPKQEAFRAKVRSFSHHNFACWCALGAPCHADVLLELANEPPSESDNRTKVAG